MTHLSNTPPDTERETDPELSYYDTAIMLWTAENLTRHIVAAEFLPGREGRNILAFMARRARNVAREFLDMEFYNLRTYLKDRMLRCQRWRAAVVRTLGGERALVRWEARKTLAAARRDNPSLWPVLDTHDIGITQIDVTQYVPPIRPMETPNNSDMPEHPPEISIFRLAPIKTGRNPNRNHIPLLALSASSPRQPRVCPRIEVTPEELRVGRTDIMDIEDANYLRAVETDLPSTDETSELSYIDIDIKRTIDRAVEDYHRLIRSIQKAVDAHIGHEIPP